MKVSVLGCGRWGSFIAWYLCNHGHDVYSWGPEEDYSYKVLKETGKNEYVELDKRIHLTCNLEEAVSAIVSSSIIDLAKVETIPGFIYKSLKYCSIAEKSDVAR